MEEEELVRLELDLGDEATLIANIFIDEGRRREREEIIESLMKMKNVSCCCDTATFGDHYLSHVQPDNLIDLIKTKQCKAV